jgi:hypothetical protein
MSTFPALAATWQNFYMLVGTAAATLVGLMFVAVTFGATRIDKVERPEIMRSFLDPALGHFVQVLVTSCLLLIPSLTSKILGSVLLPMALLRLMTLLRVHRNMKEAQKVHNDLEVSDWISGIVLPLGEHLGLGASGVLFALGQPAFAILAVVTIVVLLSGIFGAWELIVWVALAPRPGGK